MKLTIEILAQELKRLGLDPKIVGSEVHCFYTKTAPAFRPLSEIGINVRYETTLQVERQEKRQ